MPFARRTAAVMLTFKGMRSISRLGLTGLALGAVLMPLTARAAPELDQSYQVTVGGDGGFSGVTPGFRRAESFTVGIAGTLDEIDVFAETSTTTFTGVNILSTSGGVPTTTVLDLGTYGSTDSNGVATFTVSLPVTVGEVLAIEPLGASGGTGWANAFPGTYAGGGDFYINPSVSVFGFSSTGLADDFETFVDPGSSPSVPEPASMALMAAGMAGLGLIRARRRTA